MNSRYLSIFFISEANLQKRYFLLANTCINVGDHSGNLCVSLHYNTSLSYIIYSILSIIYYNILSYIIIRASVCIFFLCKCKFYFKKAVLTFLIKFCTLLFSSTKRPLVSYSKKNQFLRLLCYYGLLLVRVKLIILKKILIRF